MADEMNATGPTQPNAEGVSTPPDNGNVSDTGTSADTDNSQDIQNAQAGQPQSDPAAQPPNPAQQDQPAQPTQPAQPNIPAQPAQPTQPEVHPAVKRASMLNEIATALAGGPSYKLSIDPNTGVSTKTQVPLSGRQIGIAIALEALSGGLAGLGAKGPNAVGQAAGMGLEQGQKIAAQRQQAQQLQDQQANTDYAHHAQTLETNMRMYNNALQAGKLDLEMNQKYVGQFAPMADTARNNYQAAILADNVSEADMVKHHFAKDTAIPVSTVARLDANGNQVKNSLGAPQWDHTYLVLDPKFKADDLLTDEDRKTLVEMHMPGFVNGKGEATNLQQNILTKMGTAINLKSQIGAYRLAKDDLGNFYNTVNKSSLQSSGASTKMPEMKDPQVQNMLDTAAKQYGVDPALVRAVAIQESGGNPNATSKKGARGIMQLMPDTAKAMGVQDVTNPQQNIDGGVKYLKSLLDQFNGNTKLALAAYNAGPNRIVNGQVPNIPETTDYVKAIGSMIGLTDNAQAGVPAFNPVDLAAAVQKDPTLPKALVSFQSVMNRSGSLAEAIGTLQKSDPTAAGKIVQLYGGRQAVDAFDTQKKIDILTREQEAKATVEVQKQKDERSAKQAESDQTYTDDAKAIAGDPNDPGSGDMIQLDKLISQRTADRPRVLDMIKKINPNWNMQDAELKLHVWKDFTTDQGKQAQQVKSFNTFLQHVGGALDANDQWRRTGGGEQLNKPLTWWAKNAQGDPTLSELQGAIEPVKSEFMTFLSNNHALTEHDKAAGDNILNWNMSPAVMEQQLKLFAHTAAARAVETDHQWTRVFGNDHHFPGMISPEALSAVGKMTNPDGSNPTADLISKLDTGGSILGSSNGRGIPGQTVAKALGREGQQPQLPQGNGQPLTDPKVAAVFLKQAGGDKTKAQQLAAQNEWSF